MFVGPGKECSNLSDFRWLCRDRGGVFELTNTVAFQSLDFGWKEVFVELGKQC